MNHPAGAVARELNVTVSSVRRIPTLMDTLVYDIGTSRGDVVFKASNRPSSIDMQSWALAKLDSLGLKVPRLLACELDPSDYQYAYLITEKLPGVAGDLSATPQAFTELGAQLRAVHDLSVDGFGPLERRPDGHLRGVASSFRSFLRQDVDWCTPALLRQRLIDDNAAQRIYSAIDTMAEPQTSVLVHSDVRADHVFVDSTGGLVGIIDPYPFGMHPAWEFAQLGMDRLDLVEALRVGYGTTNWDESVFEICLLARLATGVYWYSENGIDARSRLDHFRRLLVVAS